MYVNNPSYTMKLADLLDLYKDNFNYEDLYNIVGVWLSTEKVYFFKNDDTLWNNFIQSFCDRFYSRNMNFYTTLDFKLKLRDVLRSSKNMATRVYESELLKINPLKTFSHVTDRNESSKGNSKSTNNSNGKTENVTNVNDTSNSDSKTTAETKNKTTDNGTNENTSTSYDLHSDTPSNAVNIDDLFSVAKNFVTDADNNKSHSKSTNSNTNDFTGNSSSNSSDKNERNSVTNSNGVNELNSNGTNEFLNENLFKEVSEGYDGNPTDLIEKYMNLKTDVVQFYLDEIENACLFSSILY